MYMYAPAHTHLCKFRLKCNGIQPRILLHGLLPILATVTQQPPSHGTGTTKTHAPVPPAPVMKRQPKTPLIPPQIRSKPMPTQRTRSPFPLATSPQNNEQVSHDDYDYVIVEPSDVSMVASTRSQSAMKSLMPPQRSKQMPIKRTRSLATSPQEIIMSHSDYDYVLDEPSDVSMVASRRSQSAQAHTHLCKLSQNCTAPAMQ